MKQFYRKAMQRTTKPRHGALVAAILGAVFVTTLVSADSHLNNLRPFDDPTGRVRTVSTSGEAEVNIQLLPVTADRLDETICARQSFVVALH